MSRFLPRSLHSTFITQRSPARDSNQDNAEESVPLTALDDSYEADHDAQYGDTAGHRSSSSSPPLKVPWYRTIAWKRYIILALIIYGLQKFLVYLYSDPLAWSRTFTDTLSGPQAKAIDDVIHTTTGRAYRAGVLDAQNDAFVGWLGIPYAEPPTGERRFRRAVPLKSLDNGIVKVVHANRWGDGCPRPKDGERGQPGHSGNEDCLTLNIFAPRKRIPDRLFPVMVWIHGGGFVAGSSTEEKYDPVDLMRRGFSMRQPFVFVSINYRLGGLGFTSTPPEPAEPPIPYHIPTRPPDKLDLNVGLKDQLEALKWIRQEISAWGGDPDKVTLVGHSAGAISVGLHQIYSPPELFRAAFMLSGAPTSFPVPFPHDAAARTIHPLTEPSDCPWPEHPDYGPPNNDELINCLRDLSTEEFMQATRVLSDKSPTNAFFPWYPVLEGEFGGSWLDVRPSERIIRGTFSRIPVVLGSVIDEGTRFAAPETASEQDIIDALRGTFDFTFGAVEEILEPIWGFYPPESQAGSPFGSGNASYGLAPSYKRQAAMVGDILFQAPRRFFLRETPKDFGEPSWNFLFTEPKQGADPRFGVQHGADLTSWFAHPNSTDPEMHHLSRHMAAYLINFVANLDPNGPGLRPWPQYGMDRRTLQLSRRNITVVHDDDRLDAMRFININAPMFAR